MADRCRTETQVQAVTAVEIAEAMEVAIAKFRLFRRQAAYFLKNARKEDCVSRFTFDLYFLCHSVANLGIGLTRLQPCAYRRQRPTKR